MPRTSIDRRYIAASEPVFNEQKSDRSYLIQLSDQQREVPMCYSHSFDQISLPVLLFHPLILSDGWIIDGAMRQIQLEAKSIEHLSIERAIGAALCGRRCPSAIAPDCQHSVAFAIYASAARQGFSFVVLTVVGRWTTAPRQFGGTKLFVAKLMSLYVWASSKALAYWVW